MMSQETYLCLGANLGNPQAQIEDALLWLERRALRIVSRSSWYSTEPIGVEDQPWFANLVIKAKTDLDPVSLLDHCQEAEARAGRVPTVRMGPRHLDVDILLYGHRCITSDRLVIPHPRMHERRFVLVPLLEVSPYVHDPLRNEPYADILCRLDEGKKVLKSLINES